VGVKLGTGVGINVAVTEGVTVIVLLCTCGWGSSRGVSVAAAGMHPISHKLKIEIIRKIGKIFCRSSFK
jgi:RNase P subunit RPR2